MAICQFLFVVIPNLLLVVLLQKQFERRNRGKSTFCRNIGFLLLRIWPRLSLSSVSCSTVLTSLISWLWASSLKDWPGERTDRHRAALFREMIILAACHNYHLALSIRLWERLLLSLSSRLLKAILLSTCHASLHVTQSWASLMLVWSWLPVHSLVGETKRLKNNLECSIYNRARIR